MATEDTVTACDYVGIVSANDVPDKFAKAGFHAIKSEKVNAPLIDELPMALECKVKSYEDDILIGEIVNITLGTLQAKIYNLDSSFFDVARWTELENVRAFYKFFEKHRDEFM